MGRTYKFVILICLFLSCGATFAVEHTFVSIPLEVKDFHTEIEGLSADFMTKLQSVVSQIPQDILNKLVIAHQTSNQTATVRVTSTDDIASQEKSFITTRTPIVQKGLSTLLGQSVTGKVPTIGLCFSGGGMRALLLTLGFLSAAQKNGLLDSSM